MRNRYAVLFLITVSLFLSCNKNLESVSQLQEALVDQIPGIQVIDVTTFEKKISENNVQLIDVRTEKEWNEGHLKNAQRFQINNADWNKQIATLDKHKPVYVYCATGGRSARSARQLEKAGFTEIYDLKGGITAWKEAGKPIE